MLINVNYKRIKKLTPNHRIYFIALISASEYIIPKLKYRNTLQQELFNNLNKSKIPHRRWVLVKLSANSWNFDCKMCILLETIFVGGVYFNN